MKKSLVILGIIGLIVCLSIAMTTGCAKKTGVKEQGITGEEKAPAAAPAQQPAKEVAKEAETKAPAEAEAKQEKAAPVKEEITFSDIHFDFDKYNLKPESRDVLKKLADWLSQNKDKSVLIEGNCDERGTTEYNLALGERRAQEAMKYLVELGVDAKMIKTISYGKERPLDPGHNEEAWAKNRRDHFVSK
ncbi:MAG TPA: peptidoglycan-associated lipoprotein Pal [Syntrophales bacterium]|nr:peptidoglycan-associated lipoprotein Pal [Syntrophales bacterium]